MTGHRVLPASDSAPATERPGWAFAWWTAALAAAAGYGIFLLVTWLTVPAGADLTGRFAGQPMVKALMAVFLAIAALGAPVRRERGWLLAALLLSAVGDFCLAIPWWAPAFVCGLGAFLLAHLCYLAVLVPLRGPVTPLRGIAVAGVVLGCAAMLLRFWPVLRDQGVTLPVSVYIAVLGAMVVAALLARLPTVWTATGAVLFAVSDGMIGTGQFLLSSQALELPIWWVYAAAQILITAGLLFGRSRA